MRAVLKSVHFFTTAVLLDLCIRSDTRRVEVCTEAASATLNGGSLSGGGEVMDVDERLVEALVAYKDAVDSRSLLAITFV